MAALLYLALSWLLGIMLLKHTTGGISAWREGLLSHGRIPENQTAVLSALAYASGALWTGIIITSWAVYLLAWIFDKIIASNSRIHPLFPANLTVLFIVIGVFLLYQRNSNPNISVFRNRAKTIIYTGKSRLISNDRSFLFLVGASLIFFICFSCWLMFSSFGSKAGMISASYTVFSDFAPHTALVSSFSAGRNWPTIYPHFAGDGISYHFMFFFLCGNLNWLGLPIGLAINLPSVLGMLSALILLGFLAVVLTKRTAAFLLTPFLALARSSMAFFTWFAELYRQYSGNWKNIITAIKLQREFIGNTPRDDWGLWTINVYANQRHLMPAFAIMIFVLLLFLPQITDRSLRCSFLDKRDWLRYNGKSSRELLLAGLLLFLLPFWHGSVLIALLSVLAVMAVFSRARIYYLITAIGAVSGALLQISFFSGSGGGVTAQFFWGFLAEDKSFWGLISYLAELTGVIIPLALLMFLTSGRRKRFMLAASFMPLVIAFTVSLTPDVTVNHKYIMISQMLLNIWVADLLIILWTRAKQLKLQANSYTGKIRAKERVSIIKTILLRTTVIFLAGLLVSTGITEWHIFANANQGSYVIETNNPVNEWIKKEAAADAVFITAPWHYHSFFITGRSAWLGHSYYAWSAGHDTGKRFLELQKLLAGEWSVEQITEYVENNGIDYLIVDDDLRTHAQFTVNELFLQSNFTLKAAFADEKQTKIYDLSH